MEFGKDGKLHFFDGAGKSLWDSRGKGPEDSRLSIQNDGKIIIYDKNDKAYDAFDNEFHE